MTCSCVGFGAFICFWEIMITITLNDLALKFWITVQVVSSWYELKDFSNKKEAEVFFEKNIDMIKAKPFVKWVGWKR